MQVEPDFNGLRSGSYGSWGYHHDSKQIGHDSDSLPEKIYSMVAKLVDEDNEIDLNQPIPPFATKNSGTTGFYDGTHTWSDVPISNTTSLSIRPKSPTFDPTKQILFAGLEELDLSQNMLDLSFLTSVDDLNQSTFNKIGENMDSGFASPAEKLGCMTGNTGLPCDSDVTALNHWDWEQLSNTLDPHSNHSYINLLAQNPELLDQIVRGDAAIDGLLNDSGFMPLDFLQPSDQRHSPFLFPHASHDISVDPARMEFLGIPPQHRNSSPGGGPNVNSQLENIDQTNVVQQKVYQANSSSTIGNQHMNIANKNNLSQPPGLVDTGGTAPVSCPTSHAPGSTVSSLEKFSPYRPPPEVPFVNPTGPLGFNNNDYRSYGPEPLLNGYKMHRAGKEVPIRFGNGMNVNDHDGRALAGEWAPVKPPHHFGNGLMPMGNSAGVHHHGSLSRFSAAGPFRSPPPFMPPGRLPVYPPPVDHAELYPLPNLHRHHLFSFPAPMYNFRQMRRNPIRDELSARLDQCYEQFRQLEKERKKTEADLARHNPGKKLSSANSMTVPRLPPSPTRIDRLVVDQLREHARVVTLVAKMERLRGNPFGSDVHVTLSAWDDAIRNVQALRQNEIRIRSRISLEPAHHRAQQDDKGIGALAAGIVALSRTSRHARTALWACLTVTLSASPSPAAASQQCQ